MNDTTYHKFWRKIFRDCLLNGKHCYIVYKDNEEEQIVEDIMKYTENFVLLNTAKTDFLYAKNSHCFSYSDLDIELFFEDSNKQKINYDLSEHTNLNYKKYVYLFHINDVELAKENNYEQCVSDIMLENIHLNNFIYNGFKLYNEYAILKFDDRDAGNSKTNDIEHNDIISLLGGIGDFFLTFSLVHEFLERNEHKTFYVPLVKSDEKHSYMINLCYKEKFKYIKFNNTSLRNFWDSKVENEWFKKIDNIVFKTPKSNGEHTAHLFRELLSIEPDFDLYKHADILKKNIMANLSNYELNHVEGLFCKKEKTIGLQFYTGHSNKNSEPSTISHRQWNIENVVNFINMCNEYNIQVIILSPHPFNVLHQYTHLENLSVEAYAYCISKVDMFVGIDSSGGHIASFYGVPSITLWNDFITPLIFYGSYNGYRPLRKNYSIIPVNRSIDNIESLEVFRLVKDYFDNKLCFNDNIISYEDSVNNYNILNI